MSRSDNVYIDDIKESIEIILAYITDLSEDDFSKSLLVQDAVIRRFGIIGEASAHLSENFKSRHSEVQWSLIKAMRNKLIHEYYGVSPATIYATIKQDLPFLKQQLTHFSDQL